MPQQTPRSEKKATARKAATEPRSSTRPEPQSYVAPDPRDASLAPPAAGEVDELPEDDPVDDTFGEVQMGADRNMIPGKDAVLTTQGRKTMHANRERLRSPVRGRR